MEYLDADFIQIRANQIRPDSYVYRKDGENDYQLIIMNSFEPQQLSQLRPIINKLSIQGRLYFNRENPGRPLIENKNK